MEERMKYRDLTLINTKICPSCRSYDTDELENSAEGDIRICIDCGRVYVVGYKEDYATSVLRYH